MLIPLLRVLFPFCEYWSVLRSVQGEQQQQASALAATVEYIESLNTRRLLYFCRFHFHPFRRRKKSPIWIKSIFICNWLSNSFIVTQFGPGHIYDWIEIYFKNRNPIDIRTHPRHKKIAHCVINSNLFCSLKSLVFFNFAFVWEFPEAALLSGRK